MLDKMTTTNEDKKEKQNACAALVISYLNKKIKQSQKQHKH